MQGFLTMGAPQIDGLAAISHRFQARFTEHRTYFLAQRAEMEAGGSSAALQNIAERAHRIAGVAQTLGFDAVGESTITLDRIISHGLGQGRDPAAIWAEAAPHLNRLLGELAQQG
jgi:HPt (histidine-containing phosphotransfer) domain-containing protein